MLSQPSVIARLMGMEDAATIPAATMIQEASQINLLIKPSSKQVASQLKQSKCSPLVSHPHHGSHSNGDDYYYSRRCLSKMKKPRPPRHRHSHQHPQEELLHKIKEDFQAWQRQSSEALENENDDERLGKSSSGKAGLDGRYIQMIARENLRREKMARYVYGGKCTKVEEDKVVAMKNVAAHQQGHGDSEVSAAKVAVAVAEPGKMSDKLRGGATATTRIAILRPTGTSGPVAFGTSAAAKAKRDGGMEEFLDEVKERLKSEMKMIGAGSDDTKQTAGRAMARQIRESIMAKVDIGKRLYTRSESFRVFRGDLKRAAAVAKSPEHRMQKSVIVSRTEDWSPEKTKRGIMVSSPVTSRGRRARALLTDASLSGRSGLNDQQSCTGAGADTVASPRALVRSFSAPASSGMSRALGGDSLDTSCEGAEVTSRSRSFSLHSLRHSFSLGGKLLMMMHCSKNKKPSSSSPQQSSNGRGDSFAELSLKCSSEFDAHVSESSSCCQSNAAADAESDPDKAYVGEVLVTAGLCDGDGGGSSSDDTAIARTNSMSRRETIGDDVFDEVEDSYFYYYSRRCDKNAGEEEDDGRDHRHRRMLFDLANEALQAARRSRSPATSLRRWVVDESGGGVSPSELTADVWRQVVQATENAATQTVDGMVECEVMRSPWLEVVQLQEDVSAVGRKIERAILDQLVAEAAREVFVSN